MYVNKVLATFLIVIANLILVDDTIAQPSNDEPCNAVLLIPNPNGFYCPTPAAATTLLATNTVVPIAGSCTNNNGDVWFKFVASAANHRISVSDVTSVPVGTFINAGITVYNAGIAGLCSTLSEVSCTSMPFINQTTTVGNTYYVRVNTASSLSFSPFTFNICIGSPPTVPINNDCVNALALQNNVEVGIYNDNATQSQAPYDCGMTLASIARDVWFTVSPISSGPFTVTVTEYPGQPYATLEYLAGCSGPFPPIDCDDDPFFDGDGIELTVNGVQGQTYLFRTYASNENLGYSSIKAVGAGVPLPVASYHLSAHQKPNNIVLLKLVIKEEEKKEIVLQASNDGISFVSIGIMKPSMQNDIQQYEFADNKSSLYGKTYYRARIAAGSTYIFSPTITYSPNLNTENRSLIISPNPASNFLTISVPNTYSSQPAELSIYDIAGRKIAMYKLDKIQNNIDISRLPYGLYILREKSNPTNSYKLIKN